MDTISSFSDWLRQKVASRGWKQADLVRASGLSRGTISNLFLGIITEPDHATCVRIADALGVTIQEVLRAVGLMPPAMSSDWAMALLERIEALPEGKRGAAELFVDFLYESVGEDEVAESITMSRRLTKASA
jgi:transcriptional regulator with XRE-family HTH domain